MSGGSDEGETSESISAHGIPHEEEFREVFEFAGEDEYLVGGDAVSFEVTILDGVFDCPNLHQQLKEGKKFHGLMGEIWFDTDYDDIIEDKDKYSKAKAGDFAWVYGAMVPKIAETLGLEEDTVEESNKELGRRYPEVVEKRTEVAQAFCSMRQPGGIGTNIEWHEPQDYIESIFGFRRYFTLENSICRSLFNLARKPPKHWRAIKETVVRHTYRGVQKLGGACQSAIYAAAFNIQSSNMRAATNHIIQSPGGTLTKMFQYMLWRDIQPIGVSTFHIRILNVHDELLSVVKKQHITKTHEVKNKFISWAKKYVPLINWEWDTLKNWSEK
jgi:DNA polymerase I-like protein with 3'-5' exonuclease and polymerase domains